MKSFKERIEIIKKEDRELEEKAVKMSDKQFEKYYNALLKKYKVEDVSELDKKMRKKFFDEIEANVQADDE